MTREELKDFINEFVISKGQVPRVRNKVIERNHKAYSALLKHTSWVWKHRDFKTFDLVWLFLTGLEEHPVCPSCGEKIPFNKGRKNFPTTCSNKCGRELIHNRYEEKNKIKHKDKVKFSNKEELIGRLNYFFRKSKGHINLHGIEKYPELIEGVYNYTSFLEIDYSLKKRVHVLLEGFTEQGVCECCGKPTNFYPTKGFRKYCSKKCSRQSVLKPYIDQRNEEVSYNSIDEFKEVLTRLFVKSTRIVPNQIIASKFPWIIEDIYKHTPFLKEDLPYHKRIHLILKDIKEHPKCPNCGDFVSFYKTDFRTYCSAYCGTIDRVYDWNLIKSTSKGEKELTNFIHNYYPKATKRKFTINPKKRIEVDIFVEELNLAIEYNGSYWHSDFRGQKDKNYHLDKYNFLKELGIELVQVWEHHWNDSIKRKIVESIIKNRLGIVENKVYGRKCEIKIPTKEEERMFLEENHIQGYTTSKVRVGLYYKDVLIQIMTFRKPRFNKKYDWELLRSCTKLNTTVVGGSNKLFKYCKNLCEGAIISYVDKTFFNGKSYANLGFTKIKDSPPSYWYTRNYKDFYHRSNYQKHKLEKVLDIFDKDKTEWENMVNNGFDRIWDVGNHVFINNKEKEQVNRKSKTN